MARRRRRSDHIMVDADVRVGGKPVPAGSYTLFALPTADAWTLIISKQTGEWGIPYPGESYDFGRVPMKSVEARFSDGRLHDRVRPGRRNVHAAPGLESTQASVQISEKK